jgi:hypothetical protein
MHSSTRSRATDRLGFRAHASTAVFAVAALFAAGALLDLVLLWGWQRAPENPSWEFFAIASTVESLPRLVLGLALAIVGLHLAGSTLLLAYRALGALLALIGLAGLGLALLAGMDFFALRSGVPADQQAALVSVTAKTVGLGVLEGLVLVPAGWRCLRRPS